MAGPARFWGSPTQLGYIVPDLDAALRHWVDVVGVGPFFVFPETVAEDYRLRGKLLGRASAAIALAYRGDWQIELICPTQGPSLWQEFLDRNPAGGLQHLCWLPGSDRDPSDATAAYDEALAAAADAGLVIGQEGHIGGGRFVYYETDAGIPGTVVELAELDAGRRRLFDKIRRAAADWDGRTAIATRP